MGRKGPRRSLSRSERIIRAIRYARMRFADEEFLEEINKILLREKILSKEEFGLLKEDDEDNDYRDE